MSLFTKFLCLFFTTQSATASETLSFSAQIEDESLAEEAIMLTHCLSEQSGHPWEYTADSSGPRWLKLHEEGRKIRGIYHHDGRDNTLELSPGESDEVCAKLEPNSKHKNFSVIPPNEHLSPETTAISQPEEIKKNLLWLGLGLASIGGFLLWKSHQARFRSIEMR